MSSKLLALYSAAPVLGAVAFVVVHPLDRGSPHYRLLESEDEM